MNSTQEAGIGCLLFILFLPVVLFVRGIAISVLWGWFAVPLGVSDISIPIGVGLALVYSALSGYSGSSDDVDGLEDALGKMVAALGHPLFILALGYIVHLFIV